MAMQIIEQGPRNLVIRFYGAGANTVDLTTLAPPCQDLRILRIIYDAPGDQTATTTIEGIATANLVLWTLNGHSETIDFNEFGGIPNNAGAGKTGNILVTVGDADTSVIVWFKKIRPATPWPN